MTNNKLIYLKCANIAMVSILVFGCKAPSKSYNKLKTDDIACSIAMFSGTIEEEKQLYSLMNRNGIHVGLEGSVFYDILVPVSKATTASAILQTNELTLRGKIHLYIIQHFPGD
jgi:hypothetical protein